MMGEVKVTISIPEWFLEQLDRAAQEECRSRSELFQEAARFYLEARASGARPIDDPRVRQAVAVMDQLAQHDRPVSEWDAATAVRAERERDRGR